MPKVIIFSQSCKGVDDCGICAHVCPKELFAACKEMNESGYYPPEIADPEECTGCRNCMIYCPDYAIVVEVEDQQTENAREDNDGAE